MSRDRSHSFRAPIAEYERQADALLAAALGGDGDAEARFKWQLPRFRGRPLAEVRGAALDVADARVVVAHEHAFEGWAELVAFTNDVAHDGPVSRFESAVEAVVSGDAPALASLLRDDPTLARARSTRRHGATLLHYVGANGVEGDRQRTPANAVEIATLLLDAGAEVDALADMYGERCTTMSLLVSSTHPARAGLQVALAETLLDRGAALRGPGSAWQSAVATALVFGFADTARALVRRGAAVNDLVTAAGLGQRDDAARLLSAADGAARHAALALASQLGHADVVRLLLDAGEDPDRYNPDGFHSHATPLHHAALAGHADVVRLLVERGARLDIEDTIYDATPLGWAIHGGQPAVAEWLRARGGA